MARKYLTEMDELQAAVAKVNLFESALPIVNGKVVEDTETYNKIQTLLGIQEMEDCHQFLYDIDFDDITPETVKKVNDLYDLATSKGFIEVAEPTAQGAEGEEDDQDDEGEIVAEGDENPVEEDEPILSWSEVRMPAEDTFSHGNPTCFTCFYKAWKNGEEKTGEAYSTASNVNDAKAEVIGNLSKLGLDEITIIAVERGDTVPSAGIAEAKKDAEGNDGNKEADNAEPAAEPEETPKEEEEKPEEKKAEEKPESSEENAENKPAELTDDEKAAIVQKYVGIWKTILKELANDGIKDKEGNTLEEVSFTDLDIENVAKFWKKLSEEWPEDKPDPREFMTPENIAALMDKKVKKQK